MIARITKPFLLQSGRAPTTISAWGKMSGIKHAHTARTRTSRDDNDADITMAQRRCFNWSDPGTTKKEKWLIFKLDIFVLLYVCLVS